MIPIEDLFEDIIVKTMRGRSVTEQQLAAKTGEPRDVLSRLCRGEFCDEGALPKVAKALGLDADALLVAASKAWYPRAVILEGLEQFNTPYRDMRVNSFLVFDPEAKVGACFDTGTDCSPMVKKAEQEGISVESIFLTHTHNDHIADLNRLKEKTGNPTVYSNRAEPWPSTTLFDEGDTFTIGSLQVETRTTSGHSCGGTTFVINGLQRPVAVVGDAIFAGSMGGGIVSFADAWENNLKKILTLPDETVICPGHGPMSSVREEKKHNPFFAGEFKQA
ncbi:MAG: MBL fold metallo-hydrolase [Verrucomicrobiales bacterium]|nr:MBL fold metallo-hydrolase [Verrucomicrobiales bacterium]